MTSFHEGLIADAARSPSPVSAATASSDFAFGDQPTRLDRASAGRWTPIAFGEVAVALSNSAATVVARLGARENVPLRASNRVTIV